MMKLIKKISYNKKSNKATLYFNKDTNTQYISNEEIIELSDLLKDWFLEFYNYEIDIKNYWATECKTYHPGRLSFKVPNKESLIAFKLTFE